MKYITPIIDRTASDVASRNAKAFFNVSDWLRVCNNQTAVEELIDALIGHPFTAATFLSPTILNIPLAGDLNNLISAINRIRALSGLPTLTGLVTLNENWGSGSSADAPDYTDANAWEGVLDTIFKSLKPAADDRVYCGVATTGQARFYQGRFRQHAWVPNAGSPVRRARTDRAICGAGLTRNNGWRKY